MNLFIPFSSFQASCLKKVCNVGSGDLRLLPVKALKCYLLMQMPLYVWKLWLETEE